MRLYLIRHADPDYGIDSITDIGHREAAALAERLASHGLDRVYHSPLGRARATMQYTADRLGMAGEPLEWTAEIGHWKITQPTPPQACCAWDVHGHLVRGNGATLTTDNWHEHEPFNDPLFRREFEELGERSDAFFASLGYRRDGGVYRVERPNREKIAVFCHGGLGLTWLAHLLHIPLPLVWIGFFLPPSSVTTVLFDERIEGVAVPRCIGVGDVSHLYAAGLEVQPSGIKANVD